jgi:dihydrofolate reductase
MSFDRVLKALQQDHFCSLDGKKLDIMIIGGGQIYKQLLPFCKKVYVTKIYKKHENIDAFFPNLDETDEWKATPVSDVQEYNDISYQFWVYERV